MGRVLCNQLPVSVWLLSAQLKVSLLHSLKAPEQQLVSAQQLLHLSVKVTKAVLKGTKPSDMVVNWFHRCPIEIGSICTFQQLPSLWWHLMCKLAL